MPLCNCSVLGESSYREVLPMPWTKQADNCELKFGNEFGNKTAHPRCNTAQPDLILLQFQKQPSNSSRELGMGSCAVLVSPVWALRWSWCQLWERTTVCNYHLPGTLQLSRVGGDHRMWEESQEQNQKWQSDQEVWLTRKDQKDLSLTSWLRYDLNCTKTFWVVSQEEEFQINWSKNSGRRSGRVLQRELTGICLHRVPPGGAGLVSEPLCARHSTGVHRGTGCTPVRRRGSPGAFHAHQARQQSRYCFRGVLQERGGRQGELLGCILLSVILA